MGRRLAATDAGGEAVSECTTLDRNKTALTHRTTALAAAYLDGLGCKPVETEVEIRTGWIADVASYWYPTWTEGKRLRLPALAKQLLTHEDDRARPGDLMPMVYGHGPFSVLVEVKTSRADFARDKRKWECEPPANLCFVAYPTGIVDSVPRGWYGLEVTAEARQVRKLHWEEGRLHAQHPGQLIDFIAAVGIRRDHRTTRRALVDWWKSYNAKDQERRVSYSSQKLLDGLRSWINRNGMVGHLSFEDMLKYVGVKSPTPRFMEDAAEFFETLRK